MQRPPIPVRRATPTDAAMVQTTLAHAFIDDPIMAYLFPDRATRPRKLLQFFDLIVRSEADIGDTRIAGDGAAVAVWRKPDAWHIPTSAMLRFTLPLLRTFGTALPRALRLQALVDAHHPPRPHWYLAFAGCHPARQGRGYGGAAIRAQLRECDLAGLPAALETATAGNVPIYAALGFVVTGTFVVGPGLGFWSMWRDPIA